MAITIDGQIKLTSGDQVQVHSSDISYVELTVGAIKVKLSKVDMNSFIQLLAAVKNAQDANDRLEALAP